MLVSSRHHQRSLDSLDLGISLSGRQGTYNPPDTPTFPFYFDGLLWTRRTSPRHPAHRSLKPIQFVTWNLDFQGRFASERLHAALLHLRDEVVSPYSPAIINLQEIHVTAIPTLLQHPWVRQSFQVTDVERPNIRSSYCTITLVSLSLPVTRVYRTPFFNSRMNRDALFVDIEVPGRRGGVLRVANTHLESTPEAYTDRPRQLATIARHLKLSGVVAGIVGGDLNALLPQERYTPSNPEIRLRDAFLLDQRPERDGMTWGDQNPRGMRGVPTRRDKVLYSGDVTFVGSPGLGSFGGGRGKVLKRIGVGLTCNGRYVSDHYGLKTEIVVGDSAVGGTGWGYTGSRPPLLN